MCKKSQMKPLVYSALERQVQSVKEKSLDEYLTNDHHNISMLQNKNDFKRQEISYTPRYAFFDKFQDNQEAIVRITEILSPSHFYVNIFKFEEQLRRLELDLKKEYEENLKASSMEFKHNLGQIFICKWNEDKYHRVQLINEEEIFFVSYLYTGAPEPGGGGPLELGIYRVKISKIRKTSIFLLVGPP